jgi:hypothetical protein
MLLKTGHRIFAHKVKNVTFLFCYLLSLFILLVLFILLERWAFENAVHSNGRLHMYILDGP